MKKNTHSVISDLIKTVGLAAVLETVNDIARTIPHDPGQDDIDAAVKLVDLLNPDALKHRQEPEVFADDYHDMIDAQFEMYLEQMALMNYAATHELHA